MIFGMIYALIERPTAQYALKHTVIPQHVADNPGAYFGGVSLF
jgi:hypothetical protein